MAKILLPMPVPVTQFFDDSGAPLAGGLVYSYAAGSTTLQPTFTDSAGLNANANPTVLDAQGLAIIYLDLLNYKIDVQNAAGVSQRGYPKDNIMGGIALGGVLYTYPAADGTPGQELTTNGSKVLAWTPNVWTNDFRLSLTSGTPVTTSDVTAATTLYCTPYSGNRIDLPDSNGNPLRVTSAEFSIAIPATTTQMYDVFCYNNASVPTLELLAWTNDTTRATAVTRTNGRLFKSGDNTRLYLGSCRTTGASGQIEDSVTKRYVWNYYNRLRRSLRVVDATASWTYSTNTIRQANGNAANQVDVVVGVAEVLLDLTQQVSMTNSNATWQAYAGIGEDSTTTTATGSLMVNSSGAGGTASKYDLSIVRLVKYPAIGRHFYAWVEASVTAATTTWLGTNSPVSLAGITGWIEG